MNEQQKLREVAAIKYTIEEDEAPVVLALGRGHVAQKILEKAEENKIPVVEDPALAHLLNKLNLGDQIPEELYTVVAQILVFVSELDGKY